MCVSACVFVAGQLDGRIQERGAMDLTSMPIEDLSPEWPGFTEEMPLGCKSSPEIMSGPPNLTLLTPDLSSLMR